MNDTTERPALVAQHLAAASLLLALPKAQLYITTRHDGILDVQVPQYVHDQQGLFRRVARVIRADVITTQEMASGHRHLIASGGRHDGIAIHLYAPLPQLPTEGEASEDTTDQGRPGGETAAESRAGADSREVGAVVSEASPASEEGGVGEPSADAPPEYDHDAAEEQRRQEFADDCRMDAQAEAHAEAQALGYCDDDCRAEIETDAMAELVAEASR